MSFKHLVALPVWVRPPHVRRAVLAITIAAATVAGVADRAEAAFPGKNGLIAFRGTFDCPFEHAAIGLIRADGQDIRKVTGCDDINYTPDWSPDGASLLYSSRGMIRLVDVRTLTARDVTRGRGPSFAPDGRHFAYRRTIHDRQLWRARVDGRHRRLLRTRERFVGQPLWSPSGRTIAYHQFDVGTWIVSARTGKRIRRVTGPQLDPFDWSPDGRKLLCGRLTADGYDELYIVRADGRGTPRRVTRTPRQVEGNAAWSPDGHRLVVLVDTIPKQNYYRRTMLTMNTKGTHRQVLWRTPLLLIDAAIPETINVPLSVRWQPLP